MKKTKQKVTITDIAKAAGVHRTTASRVLGNDPDLKITDVSRKRILKVAEQLQFVRHDRFANPKDVKSFGLISIFRHNRFDNPFFSDVFDGIDLEAREQKLNIYLINSMERLNMLHLLRQEEFLGVIVIGEVSRDFLAPFELTDKPLIGVEAPHHLESPSLYAVRTDSFRGMFDATDYLIHAGHRNIYYISFRNSEGNEYLASLERFEGVAAALKHSGLFSTDNRIILDNLSDKTEDSSAVDVGYRAMMELLKRNPPRPFACVCFSDLHAEGVYKAAKELGLRVPEDVSVVGYDNISRAEHYDPPLTTLNVPRIQLGRQAVKVLLATERGMAKHETILPNKLVVRKSVLEIDRPSLTPYPENKSIVRNTGSQVLA